MSGKVPDVKGIMTRDSKESAEGSHGVAHNGSKQLMGGDLKKLNISSGPIKKPKSE